MHEGADGGRIREVLLVSDGRSTGGEAQSGPSRCSEILGATLSGLGLVRAVRHLVVLKAWDRAVPQRVRERATVEDFREGTLTLVAADPVWMHELHMLRHKLKTMLNAEIGEPLVEEIFLRIGRVARRTDPGPSAPLGRRPPAFPEFPEAKIEEVLAPVKDLPCRDAVERLLRRQIARNI
jgi:hypothetical protein